MRRKLTASEFQVSMAIGHYLSIKGFCFYPQPTRGYFMAKEKRFRKDANPYTLSGLPDYVVIYRGFHIGLEVKTEKGKQSDNQKEFAAFLEGVGKGFYQLVRNLEDVKNYMEKIKTKIDEIWKTVEGVSPAL